MLNVSVVVATFNRNELLERCLIALILQDYDPAGYEIIIADDAACDETRALVEEWAGKVKVSVRYVPVTATQGPAAARNAGWRVSRGRIIAFTDDDCVPDRAWLRNGLAAFEEGIAGVRGRLVMPLPDVPTDYQLDASHLEDAEFVTANCLYRREALEQVGGFDERFTAAWREDSDVHFTLLEKECRLAHAPEALVIHPVRPAPWGISVMQQRKSMYNALLYKKHPALYRAKVQASPPWHYYAIVSALLLAVCAAVLERQTVYLPAAGAWLALTAQFCRQRLRKTSRAPEHVAEMIVTSFVIPPLSIFWRVFGAVRFRVFFL